MIRLILLATFLLSSVTFADEHISPLGGYSYGVINVDVNSVSYELYDVTTSLSVISYQHSTSDITVIGDNYLSDESYSYARPFDFTNLNDNAPLEYSSLLLTAKFQYKISKRNNLYMKVNGLQYDNTYVNQAYQAINSGGFYLGVSAGWIYRFDNGIGVKAGYDFLPLGADKNITNLATGISYHF